MNYIPFYIPHIPKSTNKSVIQVINSGWLTSGKKVQEFEQQFSKIINSKNSIVVSSGTAALHLAYLAHELGPGDEVIVPSFTFCSTINALIHVGATPVFCDIDEKSLCINPQDIQRKITSKTKAIIVVHYGGAPADMDKINDIAKINNLIVIEDAAHAFLTRYKGQYIGSGNNTTCFSFYATKNLTTGEGGMITTNNEKVSEFVQIMRNHGISKSALSRYGKGGNWRYDVIAPGYKYNMTDIEAAIGLEQIKIAKECAKKRQDLSKKYLKSLSKNIKIILPQEVSDRQNENSWHLFTIRIKNTCSISRNVLIEKLIAAGIGTSVHFIPNHMQSYYRSNFGNDTSLPITERVFNSILSLPFYEDLTDEQIKFVCDMINNLTN